MRRARRRADEEELAGIGEGQVDVLRIYGRVLAEIDTAILAENGLAIPNLAHGDGCLIVEEGDNDAPERFEG